MKLRTFLMTIALCIAAGVATAAVPVSTTDVTMHPVTQMLVAETPCQAEAAPISARAEALQVTTTSEAAVAPTDADQAYAVLIDTAGMVAFQLRTTLPPDTPELRLIDAT